MEKRKISTDDLFKLYSVTNPQLSPNGKEAVFVRTHINEEENKYVSNLFHIDLGTTPNMAPPSNLKNPVSTEYSFIA